MVSTCLVAFEFIEDLLVNVFCVRSRGQTLTLFETPFDSLREAKFKSPGDLESSL